MVRLYVAVQLAYRGQVVNPSGPPAQIVLGYSGTDAAVLEAPFYGARRGSPAVRRGVSGRATAIVGLMIGVAAGCGNNRPAVDAADTADTAGDTSLGSDRAYFDGPPVNEQSAGTVMFQLVVDASTSYCEQVNACSGAEMHFSVLTADGQPLATPSSYTYDGGVMQTSNVSIPDCSQPCQPPQSILAPCPESAQSFTGTTTTWYGDYSEQLWCGAYSCARARFVVPGFYVVVMCATPGAVQPQADSTLGATCAASGPPSCVRVPFDFPSASPVVGHLASP